MPDWVIAGLGNPGIRYRKTRHNAGFDVVDFLAARHACSWKLEKRFEGEVAAVTINGKSCLLLKPQTFMNESGRSIGALLRFHKHPADRCIVIFDEYQIPVGSAKLSIGGGNGGHNGLASTRSCIDDTFIRYRIGIAPETPPPMDIKDFVLGRFSETERITFEQHLQEFADGVVRIVDTGAQLAMNLINQRKSKNDTDARKTAQL
ncbi:MAG: aminoacyl-tRNA hydrolase [Opitutales bacterium]|nr:aminoacyl-tRNA hydrolase [Opitutales bacterium]